METEPKHIWTILKTSWTPQPRWLSDEGFEPASPAGHAPIVLAPGQHRHAGEPASFEGGVEGSLPEKTHSPAKERRKIHRDLHAGSSVRDLCIEPVKEKSFVEPAIGPCRPARETKAALKLRNRTRNVQVDNVVDLRPRQRDEVCATEILNALRAACEAHNAGNEEVMMARIKMLYHLFDDGSG